MVSFSVHMLKICPQIVPYLICMSTDHEQRVSHTADKELQDIEKKYPGFIHMKLMKGIMLSFRLQQLLQKADGKRQSANFTLSYSCVSAQVDRCAVSGKRRASYPELLTDSFTPVFAGDFKCFLLKKPDPSPPQHQVTATRHPDEPAEAVR